MNGLNSKDEERYLSKQIDYDREIEPYRFIMIHAGVGSGKNRFIDNLVRGGVIEHRDGQHAEKHVAAKTVLLITSRRSKVNEQLNSKVAKYDKEKLYDSFIPWWMDEKEGMEIISSRVLKLPDLGGLVTNEIFMRSHVQTNAKVEFAQRDEYSPSQSITQPWFCYDLIVVDEVHSVVADASYQSAPFYVRRLIERTLEINSKCKVIVMTGTPQVLKGVPLFENAHLIDMMETCINVKPARIEFLTAFEARQKQLEMMKRGEKFVAFFNHISVLMGLHREMPDYTVMSFSDEAERKKLDKNDHESYERMLAVEKHLAKENMLPDDVGAFLTTSRNKEGINIENTDVKAMFVDAHAGVDVIQMAGRVREGLDVLYVVVNSRGYADRENPLEAEHSERPELLDAINREYEDICAETCFEHDDPLRDPAYENEKRRAFIDYIHEKYPYIRYDYYTDLFCFYPERKLGKAYYAAQEERFEHARQVAHGLEALAQEWFPGIRCKVSKYASALDDKREGVEAFLKKYDLVGGKRLNKEMRDKLLVKLNELLGTDWKKLGALLKHCGFRLVPVTDSRKTDAPYIIVKIEE